jgi:ParB family chromosome partitioning protein
MNIQMIQLNRLAPCPANVRKSGTGIGIDELAASIAAHGLLQNLQVRSGKSGKFEVVAGARRLAALKMLAKQKALVKTAEIPCNLLDEEDAGEISLAENTVRLPMHPADQFTAFHTLAATGKGPEEIAGRFGCTAAVVRQRLKLATVSPRLLDLYRGGAMDLDQLMAFTLSDDHGSQEAAWFEQPAYGRNPFSIRRILTAAQVEANHHRARFVGLDAYVAAGGTISRDLFQPEHEGYLTDPALLDRLAAEKLEREAATIRAEGWAWTEIMPDMDYNALRGFERVAPIHQPLAAEQAKELDRLTAAYEQLIEEHGEDPEPEIARELQDLSERIDFLSAGCYTFQPDDRTRAGAIISIGRDGATEVERGLIRAEDRQGKKAAPKAGTGQDGNAPSPAPLSDRLIEDLTAHRTAALRSLLADDWMVALAAVVQAMALPVFYSHSFGSGTCLDLRAHSADLRSHAEGIADSPAAVALAAHHAAWLQRLPETAETLWAWLLAQTPDTLTALLAYCAACTVSAVRKPQDRADAPHVRHADQLAAALDLDMTRWWRPTAAGYLGRVSKARILEAVTGGVSKGAAENLAKLKKDALAARAEEKLAGTGWLPAILREPVPVFGACAGLETAFSEAA